MTVDAGSAGDDRRRCPRSTSGPGSGTARPSCSWCSTSPCRRVERELGAGGAAVLVEVARDVQDDRRCSAGTRPGPARRPAPPLSPHCVEARLPAIAECGDVVVRGVAVDLPVGQVGVTETLNASSRMSSIAAGGALVAGDREVPGEVERVVLGDVRCARTGKTFFVQLVTAVEQFRSVIVSSVALAGLERSGRPERRRSTRSSGCGGRRRNGDRGVVLGRPDDQVDVAGVGRVVVRVTAGDLDRRLAGGESRPSTWWSGSSRARRRSADAHRSRRR